MFNEEKYTSRKSMTQTKNYVYYLEFPCNSIQLVSCISNYCKVEEGKMLCKTDG